MKFEYKQLKFEACKIENGDAKVEDCLNKLGQEGWELVGFSTFSTTDIYGSGNGGDIDISSGGLGSESFGLYVLKRQL